MDGMLQKPIGKMADSNDEGDQEQRGDGVYRDDLSCNNDNRPVPEVDAVGPISDPAHGKG